MLWLRKLSFCFFSLLWLKLGIGWSKNSLGSSYSWLYNIGIMSMKNLGSPLIDCSQLQNSISSFFHCWNDSRLSKSKNCMKDNWNSPSKLVCSFFLKLSNIVLLSKFNLINASFSNPAYMLFCGISVKSIWVFGFSSFFMIILSNFFCISSTVSSRPISLFSPFSFFSYFSSFSFGFDSHLVVRLWSRAESILFDICCH